ncbi:hypothetical protein HNV12_11155 [Methanococcoides sp. SA1]|nr:hypothetical protein [Methanococcoides sp. SA1]
MSLQHTDNGMYGPGSNKAFQQKKLQTQKRPHISAICQGVFVKQNHQRSNSIHLSCLSQQGEKSAHMAQTLQKTRRNNQNTISPVPTEP